MNFQKLLDQALQKGKQKQAEKQAELKASIIPPLADNDPERSRAHKKCPSPFCDKHYSASAPICGEHGSLLVPVRGWLLQPDEIVLGGRFKIKKWIARGSLHEIFAAEDQQTGDKCAVKILRWDLGFDTKTVHHYAKEVGQNISLNHPHIAKTFAHGTKEDELCERPLSAGEWLEGVSLAKRINRDGNIEWREALDICVAVCEALEYAHSCGIMHKDLRPSNIFLLSDGNVKVTDFGLAERLLRGLEWTKPKDITVTGSVYGDPSYLDPHYALKGKAIPGSDIYSLGCILYECLTAVQPFTGDNELQVLFANLMDRAEPVSSKEPALKNTGLDKLVEKCLAKDPADRYQSAKEMRDALLALKK